MRKMANRKTSNTDRNVITQENASVWWSLLQGIAALIIIAGGVYGARYLVKMKKPVRKIDAINLAPLVETRRLGMRDIEMIVRGHGTVAPKVKVEIVPEVPGKLVYVHPQFKAGGLIKADEEILRIDSREYGFIVQQANAAVAETEVRLDTEKAEAMVARKEWEKLHPETEPTSPLVLRLPQIRRAESALESAKAQLAIAKLRLERTSISLPFDVLVMSERADLGQYVVTGQSLGVANGIEFAEIEVPLEDGELAWFDVFESSGLSNHSKTPAQVASAKVIAEFAGAEHVWEGRVVRTTGQVDTTSRMISVVVEVAKPFDTDGKPPLLPGIFVEILIHGKTVRGVIAVPRDAVREGNKAWIVVDDELRIITLKIIRTDKDYAYITSGLDDGASIVTSSLDVVLDGMAVRMQPLKAGGDSGGGAGNAGKSARSESD